MSTEATFGEAPEEEAGGEVLDLMEALRRSVEASRDRAKPQPQRKSKQSRSAS